MTVAKFLAASLLAAPVAALAAQTASPADSGRKADRAVWIAGAATGGALFLLFTRSTHQVIEATSPNGRSGFTPHPARPITVPATLPVPSPAGGSTAGSTQDPTPKGSRADSTFDPPNTVPQSQPQPPSSNDGSLGLSFTNAPGSMASTDPNGATDGRGTAATHPSTPQEPPASTDEPSPPFAPHFAFSGSEQPFTAPDNPLPAGGDPGYTSSSPDRGPDGGAAAFVAPDGGTSTVPEPGSFALTATGIMALVPLIRRRK